MAWAKIDDRFFSHPKVRRAGKDAVLLYLAGLTYCNEHLTDGFIPDESLPFLGMAAFVDDVKQSASKLLDVGLWHVASKGSASGYMVHDYFDHNPTREQVEITKAARAEAGSRGGRASAASKSSKTPSKSQANPKQKSSNIPSPPLPSSGNTEGVAATPPPPDLAPQVRVYLENGGKFPTGKLADGTLKKQRAIEFISDRVRDDTESLELWARVVAGYCAQWSALSYTVMVNDYYAERRIPGAASGKNGASKHGTGSQLGIAATDGSRPGAVRKPTAEEQREWDEAMRKIHGTG